MSTFRFCLAALMSAAVFVASRGEDSPKGLFDQNCAPCHGKDGKARTPAARKLGVKDLTQSKVSDQQIEQQIRTGNKSPDGKSRMPAFDERLSADQVKLLIRYVKELQK